MSERIHIHTAEHLDVRPLIENYATTRTQDAFDWNGILEAVYDSRALPKEDPLYLVVFRSQLHAAADTAALLQHDTAAHQAALESPALIHYFGGTPDASGNALSFCLWENAEAAKAISGDPRHEAAKKMVAQYASYSLEKYDLTHIDGQTVFTEHRAAPLGNTAIRSLS